MYIIIYSTMLIVQTVPMISGLRTEDSDSQSYIQYIGVDEQHYFNTVQYAEGSSSL